MRLKAVINVIVIYTVILLFISIAYAGKSIPRGWRVPINSEMQNENDENDKWRNSDKNKYLLVEGDFNGDGVRDEARLLISKKNQPRLGLFAFVSQKDGTFKTFLLIEVSKDPSYFQALGIEKVSPGEYLTACGKGITDCEPGEPDKVLLIYDGINFFKEGSASMYFYWESVTKDFKKTYIDD
jgi:hypothetical protein